MTFTAPGIALALLRAIALLVVRMCAALLTPVLGVTFTPRALRLRLVVAVIGIALATLTLPATTSLALTGRRCAETLLGGLRTRMEGLATASALLALHGRLSSQEPSTSLGDYPTTDNSAVAPANAAARKFRSPGQFREQAPGPFR